MKLSVLDVKTSLIDQEPFCERSRNAFQGDKSEFNRVKLALLLVPVPASPLASAASANATDDGDLIALLEPLVRNTAASAAASMAVIPVPVAPVGMRALAMLLYGMAQDRQKLREQWREAQVRLNAMRRDDSKEVEARALRARVEDLERKLAALKSIDRSVNRRSEAQRGAAPVAEAAR